MEFKRRRRALIALVMVLGLLAGACGDKGSTSSDGGDDDGGGDSAGKSEETIRLAPQDFAESKTLTEVYGQYLEAKGFKVEIQPAKGFREQVYPGLKDGTIDMIIDYSGSAANELDPDGLPSADSDETYARLETALEKEGLVAYEYSQAEDKNALVMLKTFADANGITTISDIKPVQDQIVLGGAADCAERTDCLLGYQDPEIYGINFKEFKALEYGPALTAALEANEIQAAQYQTTAPAIETGDFVVLQDDKGLLSADNIVPVLRAEVAVTHGDELKEAVDALSAKLTTEDLVAWNVSTDVDKEEPADVAEKWLEESGLL
jgi:osmoprotectant transport system substrate-binding protein